MGENSELKQSRDSPQKRRNMQLTIERQQQEIASLTAKLATATSETNPDHSYTTRLELQRSQEQIALLQEKVVKMMDQCQESLDLLMHEKEEKE